MKKIAVFTAITLLLPVLLAGCGSSVIKEENKVETVSEELLTVGFSQLGAESDWRNTNTVSMQEALSKENGFNLVYKNGQQKQANQITAVRMFIQQGVDYIVLAPATETGWDIVLAEARDANIPVILVDRRVDVSDKGLYSCWVGSDFELESKKVTAWLKAFSDRRNISPENIHIVNIQGSIGSTAQIGRTRGLANAAREYGWDLLTEASGDFTENKGREVMAALLKGHDNINVVYCENDNMAIGAIDAIESAGRKVGPNILNGDIMVVSFDGVNEQSLDYCREGKISCIAECNPLHGPRVRALIEALQAGETPEKFNYVDERIFSSLDIVDNISVDGITYDVEEP
ncbi:MULTISPECIES: ABC transporter substrate-binding protein [unclassified Butyrivibrio]|uniref:ABC transporter substrate-binding protein n=1 Tax=unclassified Butyrivibrio TaxID=2639466 RepID=UPI0003F8CB17|nr:MULTISPECIES: ABC transporter substrate-binding protein [unclassified Butyrivibrio]